MARRRGRGEGRTTGRGPVEAKRWGSEKGVGKYDGWRCLAVFVILARV